MTLIAGLIAKDGAVWMAGDSAASNNNHVWVRKDRKVWTAGEMVLGFSGSFRARDILQYQMSAVAPGPQEDIDSYMRTSFIENVKTALRHGGFVGKFTEGHESQLSQLLVGIRGRLYAVSNDFHVGEVITDFMTIGSGHAVANGALWSNDHLGDPQARLRQAMDAATFFVPSVRPPYNYVRTLALSALSVPAAAA